MANTRGWTQSRRKAMGVILFSAQTLEHALLKWVPERHDSPTDCLRALDSIVESVYIELALKDGDLNSEVPRECDMPKEDFYKSS